MKLLSLVFVMTVGAAFAQTGGEHWVATWSTPQPLIRGGAAPTGAGAKGFADQTVRMAIHTSIGGRRLRVKLANPFGGARVTIGGAHVAIRGKESAIVPASDRALLFNGKPMCVIGPGMAILSDPVDLTFPALADLAVSLYFPEETGPPSAHGGMHTTYVSKGNVTGDAAIADATTTQAYYFVEAVDVMAPASAGAIVTLGDSITDGARSTPDTNSMWPAVLAARLAANRNTAGLGVANMGIGGNRVLRDGSGASALARFDRDVLGQAGVKWVIVLEGINDIGHGNTEPASTDDLIGAFRQMIEQAHTHGIKVAGCTLPPFEGANYYREDGEAVRQGLNAWIRTGGAFDAVIDFEAAMRDPVNPKRIRAEFDPGDHLHPNDAGYRAMADLIDLRIFSARR